MCGIAGEVSACRERAVDGALLKRMCMALRHRGPDDEGILVEGHIGLGMRRLSIIDLNTGNQPIDNEDGSITVIFNGEIYNYQNLRQKLQNHGHKFKTRSDTEVIVHLYEDFGDNFVEKLHGMFALGLFDRNKQKLLLARDRLGVKPLYYHINKERLIFGSEIKAILQDRTIPRIPDFNGIDRMISYGYTVPPTTCFQNINELPRATVLKYQDGQIRFNQYWDLVFNDSNHYQKEVSLKTLLKLLREAVQSRMISDVPLGAFLSGGVDSSLVVALMSEISEDPVKTFSIGFEDPSFSELPYARQVANKYGTEHREFVIKPDVISILPKLIYHHDIPFCDSSAIPTYYLCKLAREYVTVALSGDGGDELFAGYNLYLADKAAKYYQMVPLWVRNFLIKPLSSLIPESTSYLNKGRVLREFTLVASLTQEERYKRWSSKVKEETRQELYKLSELTKMLDSGNDGHLSHLFASQPNASDLNKMLYVGMNTGLAGGMLVKVDRMSMASSLEVRSPLLDHQLHEFCATLPDQAKLKGWMSKYLLKELAKKFVPSNLLIRPKHGFSVPLDRWFREDLSDFVRDILFDSSTKGREFFHHDKVVQIVEEHIAGNLNFGKEIWMLLTIELWHRLYIDKFEYEELI